MNSYLFQIFIILLLSYKGANVRTIRAHNTSINPGWIYSFSIFLRCDLLNVIFDLPNIFNLHRTSLKAAKTVFER